MALTYLKEQVEISAEVLNYGAVGREEGENVIGPITSGVQVPICKIKYQNGIRSQWGIWFRNQTCQVVPPIEMSETLGTGLPEASYEEAMGPAL